MELNAWSVVECDGAACFQTLLPRCFRPPLELSIAILGRSRTSEHKSWRTEADAWGVFCGRAQVSLMDHRIWSNTNPFCSCAGVQMAQAATRRQIHCFNLLRQVRILQRAGMTSAQTQMKDIKLGIGVVLICVDRACNKPWMAPACLRVPGLGNSDRNSSRIFDRQG